MKRYLSYSMLFGVLLFTQVSCNSDDSIKAAAKQSVAQLEQTGVKNMQNDAIFVAEAASADMLYLQLSKEAITRGVSPEVKAMAQQMQEEHEQMLTELQELSSRANFVLPQTLGNAHKEIYEEVASKEGIAFDLAYIREVRHLHDELLDRYQDMAENGVSMEVKQYASRQLPLIRQHLEQAEALEKKIQ
jgi:putative membrane protein